MARTKSSKVAQTIGLLESAITNLKDLNEEYDQLLQDSATLKTLRPALANIHNVLSPADIPTDTELITDNNAPADTPKHGRKRKLIELPKESEKSNNEQTEGDSDSANSEQEKETETGLQEPDEQSPQ